MRLSASGAPVAVQGRELVKKVKKKLSVLFNSA
jgi:hypothetical protein